MTASTLQRELGKRQPFHCPAVEAFLNLMRTSSMLGHETRQLLKRHGLSESTYNILRIIRGHRRAAEQHQRAFDGMSCSTISAQMVTPVPDITRLVDRLVRARLAKRKRSGDDRRVVYVDITQRGLQRLEKIDAPLDELHEQQLRHMTTEELHTLNTLLVKARQRPQT